MVEVVKNTWSMTAAYHQRDDGSRQVDFVLVLVACGLLLLQCGCSLHISDQILLHFLPEQLTRNYLQGTMVCSGCSYHTSHILRHMLDKLFCVWQEWPFAMPFFTEVRANFISIVPATMRNFFRTWSEQHLMVKATK